jgi:hypothetical protein
MTFDPETESEVGRPKYLPDFYAYLLRYPNGKPAKMEHFLLDQSEIRIEADLTCNARLDDAWYTNGVEPAEKQLYSSHYFETALDLTFCIRENANTKQPGFYLTIRNAEVPAYPLVRDY